MRGKKVIKFEKVSYKQFKKDGCSKELETSIEES